MKNNIFKIEQFYDIFLTILDEIYTETIEG